MADVVLVDCLDSRIRNNLSTGISDYHYGNLLNKRDPFLRIQGSFLECGKSLFDLRRVSNDKVSSAIVSKSTTLEHEWKAKFANSTLYRVDISFYGIELGNGGAIGLQVLLLHEFILDSPNRRWTGVYT